MCNQNKDTSIIDFNSLVKLLGIQEDFQPWAEGWESSQSTFPISGNIDFLKPEFIIKANPILGLSDDAIKATLTALEIINRNQYLSRLIWHCHHLLFHRSIIDVDFEMNWSSLYRTMGEYGLLFSVILFISGIPHLMDFNNRKGIPLEITIDTLSDLRLWMEECKNRQNRWGLMNPQWFIYHFIGKLYRLGRLQFGFYHFTGKLKVFINPASKRIVALSEPDVTYRKDGLIDGTNGIKDIDSAWVSRFDIDKENVVGNPISPKGYASKELIKLPIAQWQQVLTKGDPVLTVHIPSGSKMSHGLCGESFLKALDFFPRYFPESPFSAFTCGSWLLDPQMQILLPSSSNIVKFQREFYLYPILSGDQGVFDRVFGGKPKDLNKAPRNTLLQQVILDHIMNGNHMRSGGGFILKDYLDWGKNGYQGWDDSHS